MSVQNEDDVYTDLTSRKANMPVSVTQISCIGKQSEGTGQILHSKGLSFDDICFRGREREGESSVMAWPNIHLLIWTLSVTYSIYSMLQIY